MLYLTKRTIKYLLVIIATVSILNVTFGFDIATDTDMIDNLNILADHTDLGDELKAYDNTNFYYYYISDKQALYIMDQMKDKGYDVEIDDGIYGVVEQVVCDTICYTTSLILDVIETEYPQYFRLHETLENNGAMS